MHSLVLVVLVLLCTLGANARQRERERVTECTPTTSQVVQLTYATIGDSRIVSTRPLRLDFEGYILEDITNYNADLQVSTYENGKWVEEGKFGPVPVSKIGLPSTLPGRVSGSPSRRVQGGYLHFCRPHVRHQGSRGLLLPC